MVDRTVENLQCFCKRTINDSSRPDIKGFKCKCSGFDSKTRNEIVIKTSRFIVVNKK